MDSPDLSYDAQTIEIMKLVLRPKSNCVDVGCHVGAVLRPMLSRSPWGLHFAFEPLPQLYSGLASSLAGRNNVLLFDIALSDKMGTSSFQHVVSNPAYSGFRERTYDRPNEQLEEIVVRTAPLDYIVPPNITIDFMKVDVEGAELQVFQGAIATIKRSRPTIVFEHGLGAADHYGTDPDDIYRLLVDECGLTIALMSERLASPASSALSRQAFHDEFWQHRNYYFVAHP
jgi:FkbM family methyltransferase